MKFHSYLGLIVFLLPLGAACSETNTPEVEVRNTEAHGAADVKDASFQKFAFGSCSKQFLPQPLWKNIALDHPQAFVWTGDVVYADTEDMGKLSQIYASELKQPEYASFLATGIPILGVWDDHDYGEGDGDKNYGPKQASQKLFLDFLGEHGIAFEDAAAARQAAGSDHNRRETPMFAESIARHALARNAPATETAK